MEKNTVPSVFDEMEQDIRVEYATPLERFVHYVVDGLLFWAFNHYVVLAVVSALGILPEASVSINVFVISVSLFQLGYTVILKIAFFTLIEGATGGRTLGKLLTGSVATDEHCRPVSWKDACIRSLCRVIPFEPFSGLFGNWWHDSISHTMVLKKRSVRRN
jgi:uncharacterized RDD family membrane protein YckC